MDLREFGLVNPSSNWYYQSKLKVISRDIELFLKGTPRIRDIGAGDGFFTREIINKLGGSGNCVDTNYPERRTELNISFTHQPELSNPNVVLFIDVLEHVDNPVSLISSSLQDINESCLLVVSVPAFKSLWSGHDEYLGHVDRYNLKDLRLWLGAIDGECSVLEQRYLYSILFLPVLIYRFFRNRAKSDLQELPKALNALLLILCNLEHSFIKNRLFGISSYMVLRFTPSTLHNFN